MINFVAIIPFQMPYQFHVKFMLAWLIKLFLARNRLALTLLYKLVSHDGIAAIVLMLFKMSVLGVHLEKNVS